MRRGIVVFGAILSLAVVTVLRTVKNDGAAKLNEESLADPAKLGAVSSVLPSSPSLPASAIPKGVERLPVMTVAIAKVPPRNKADDGKALDHFVGVWTTAAIDKPSKLLPAGAERVGKECAARILKNRFVLGREISQPDGLKSLRLMTYDPITNSYPSWSFNSKDALGEEWRSTWDESTTTLVGAATGTPRGWTSGREHRFPDRSTCTATSWMKDETEALFREEAARKTREHDSARDEVVAAWSRVEKSNTALLAEMNVLERLVGSWDATSVSKPAEWTPREVRTTSKVTRTWVLDGQFVMDASEVSDGRESLSLLTYDLQSKSYLMWWFSSAGHSSFSTGKWDAASATMSFKIAQDNGLVARSTMRFLDNNRHVLNVVITDGNGKLYHDKTWDVTRRTE